MRRLSLALLVFIVFLISAVPTHAQLIHQLCPDVACTHDVRLCPDGSSVSRTGCNCEFAACPATETPLVPTPTPPLDCFYQQVECIQAPCDPILVCPDPAPTSSDLNDDGTVNLLDYSLFSQLYIEANDNARIDFNGDGEVNLIDYTIFVQTFTS